VFPPSLTTRAGITLTTSGYCLIKNLNSFKAVKAALEYEQLRQAGALDAGQTLSQETRLWDDVRQKTHSMRSKEEAHDYRYFPEPDLPPLVVSDAWRAEIAATMPELPEARRKRMIGEAAAEAELAAIALWAPLTSPKTAR